MRRTLANASALSSRRFTGRHMFIGTGAAQRHEARVHFRGDRARVRARAGSAGQSFAAGNFSARYSRIASDSQTLHAAVDQRRHLAGAGDLRQAAA